MFINCLCEFIAEFLYQAALSQTVGRSFNLAIASQVTLAVNGKSHILKTVMGK